MEFTWLYFRVNLKLSTLPFCKILSHSCGIFAIGYQLIRLQAINIKSLNISTMRWLLFICISMLLFACNNYTKAENPLDAAREFIDACLKGDFDKASYYMLQDKENKAFLDKVIANYKSKSSGERQQYNDANIVILEEDTVN